MSATVTPPKPAVVHYPDSDGKPMADNTIQFRWIMMLYTHLAGQFRDEANTFVAADHLIYPVEGESKNRQAPDVYVAFGRPKGDRGSYKVWLEGGIFPQVVFEVLSPGNRPEEMARKFVFYELHGAEVIGDDAGDSGFACTGESGKPEGEAGVFHVPTLLFGASRWSLVACRWMIARAGRNFSALPARVKLSGFEIR